MNSEKYFDIKIFVDKIDSQRRSLGFMTVNELIDLNVNGNVVIDPFSTLISETVNIGAENVFYPNTIIEKRAGGHIKIGNKNIIYPQTLILAGPGKVIIGNNNQFGDGGVSIKANYLNSEITIGNNGRYLNGVQMLGVSHLGSGTQIIGGQLTVQDCYLEDGQDFLFADPDQRGGVIKGFGLVRNLKIMKGKVINGLGTFDESMIKDQSFYHQKK